MLGGLRRSLASIETSTADPACQMLRELANIAAGAMVFGRFLADRPFSVWWALAGVALWGLFVGLAVVLVKRNEP